jgi:hypothetical protein
LNQNLWKKKIKTIKRIKTFEKFIRIFILLW